MFSYRLDIILEFLSVKGCCIGWSESAQNATLLEITCHGSIIFFVFQSHAFVKRSENENIDIGNWVCKVMYIKPNNRS